VSSPWLPSSSTFSIKPPLTGEYPSHTKKFYDKPFEEFLTKEEAASLVCKSRIIEGRSTFGIDYDPVVRAELTNKGLALPPEGANCKFVGGKDIEMEESEEWEDSEDSESG